MAHEFIARKGILALADSSISGSLSATTFVKSGGTSSQFLKADGSVDSTTYITSSGSITGNAATATTWQTARTLTIGSTGKSVNGSADVSWSLAEIGALPLAGGTLTGGVEIQNVITGASYATSEGLYTTEHNNLIFRGDPTYGKSGILFTSSKGTTSINQTSDKGFIQFQSYGGTATTGESNNLVIGVGNDSDDNVIIQTPSATGFKHVTPGGTEYTVWDAGNLTNLNQLTNGPGYITGNQTITLSGVVTGSGTTAITTSIADAALSIAKTSGLQTALDAKAPLASPALTGTPTAPTATAGTNTTQIATTSFVGTAISNLVASAPGTLDTLNELAAALGDDPNFATTVTNNIATKLPLSGGTMTGNVVTNSAVVFDTTAAQITNSARIFFGQLPTNLGSSNSDTQTLISGYGADGYGIILESGYALDAGGLKITDDGVIIWGAADEGLLILRDEDGNATRLSVGDTGTLTANGGTVWSSGNFTDNHTNWDAAYTHVSSTSNPHSVTAAQIGAAATNQTMYIGTTAVAINRTSGALSLTGVSIDGNAGSVTNGVYTTGSYADPSWITTINYSKLTGTIPTWNQNTTGTSAGVSKTVAGTNTADLLYAAIADNDFFRLRVGGTATNAGYVEIATADDGTEPIYVRQYTGTFATLTRTATLLDGSGNTIFPGTVTATGTNANSTNWTTAYNDKINSISFNTGDGVLTLTQQDSTTLTVDLDGRFTDNSYADAMDQNVTTTSTPTFNYLTANSGATFSGNVGILRAPSTYALHVNGSFAATTKSFVIDHPTKENHSLRYGSLEGPENGVYVRGRLKENNVIELPDYWVKLVNEDSITVNLTPIGKSQNLYVKDIENNKIYVGGAHGKNINCFYTVFGERKDVDKLEVEFKN